jgi:hypothetical protein
MADQQESSSRGYIEADEVSSRDFCTGKYYWDVAD